MARRSRKLPFASAGGEPELTISEGDWKRIEAAYGNELPPDVRKAVLGATQEFRYSEVFERTVERVFDAEAIIDACKKGASEFQRMLLVHAFKSSDAGVYAKQLIKRHFHDARLGNKDGLFHTLSGLLTSFNVACTNALRELNDPKSPSFREGAAWTSWIFRLVKITDDNKLPNTVRRDTDKNKGRKESAFTLFVWELQSCLPVECRRHTFSKGALADAICEARKRAKDAIAKRQKSGAKRPRATAE